MYENLEDQENCRQQRWLIAKVYYNLYVYFRRLYNVIRDCKDSLTYSVFYYVANRHILAFC